MEKNDSGKAIGRRSVTIIATLKSNFKVRVFKAMVVWKVGIKTSVRATAFWFRLGRPCDLGICYRDSLGEVEINK